MGARIRRIASSKFAVAAALFLGAIPAHAEMVLSKVIVDLAEGKRSNDEIEVWNDGADRIYVVAEPSVIESPGLPDQRRVPISNPATSGLLVSPQRIILEPGERRQVRIAAILPRADRDRVFRVTIKPVAGPVTANTDALKVFVGYDVLVLQRAASAGGEVRGERSGASLTLVNTSNTAWEVFDGRQCSAGATGCVTLPATRLYAGAELKVPLPNAGRVEYKATNGASTRTLEF